MEYVSKEAISRWWGDSSTEELLEYLRNLLNGEFDMPLARKEINHHKGDE